MQYTFEIPIPASTDILTPTREIAKLCYGRLNRVQIDFPWGCAGLVGVRILHFEHQVYPTNPSKWFVGNDISIIFDCDYPIIMGFHEWKVEGYNEDNFYQHAPIVGFNVLPIGGGFDSIPSWIEG